MEYSNEQNEIFDFIQYSVGNCVIQARAGSGKSTTIIKAIDFIPDTKTILYIAHNREVVDKLKTKIGERNNIKILTYHGLGYSILLENFKNKNFVVNEYKYHSYVRNNLSEISNNAYDILTSHKKHIYHTNIIELIEFSRHNKAQKINDVIRIADKYGITFVSNEAESVIKILQWGQNNIDEIDYTDMVWLPYELNIRTKWYCKDWVFVDEAQDSSPIQQELFKKCISQRGGRFVVVGDEKQSINAWCGADENAMNNFLKISNTESLSLKTSFRCPKSHILMAQSIVPDIIATNNAEEGEINYEKSIYDAKNGDLILCRNTVPLIKLHLLYLKNGIKSYISGCDIAKNFIAMIESTHQESIDVMMCKDGIIPNLYKQLFEIIRIESEKYNIDKMDVINSLQITNFYDSIESIKALSEGLFKKEELIQRINSIFNDSELSNEGIKLSTIHKAKGGEADNVFILCPSMTESKMARKKWEIVAEKNILYVALTRSKHTLNFISEKEFPPEKEFFNNKSFHERLKKIANIINIDF